MCNLFIMLMPPVFFLRGQTVSFGARERDKAPNAPLERDWEELGSSLQNRVRAGSSTRLTQRVTLAHRAHTPGRGSLGHQCPEDLEQDSCWGVGVTLSKQEVALTRLS